MSKILRIGTRDSQLAVWQATWVHNLLKDAGLASELVYIKSEGDLDTVTPLYALGVQGVFTKALDSALLAGRIDLAVHSMKDVPTQLAQGISQSAVLPRASTSDILVYKNDEDLQALGYDGSAWNAVTPPAMTIATGSIRRTAQWLNRYPGHHIDNLRGNVNTRLRKLSESVWTGAIFAAAGLERIHLRPETSVDLDWMLPAPAQGAVVVVCRENDDYALDACRSFNDETTALCTAIERDFLRTLMGGCSTPISALAAVEDGQVVLKGNIVRPDGSHRIDIEERAAAADAATLGERAARKLLHEGGDAIIGSLRQKGPATHGQP